MNRSNIEVEEDFSQREIEEYIDAKPKKRIIKNKAMRCSFNNAMAEVIDNCLDYWIDIERPRKLKIEVDIENPQATDPMVLVKWNMGVPKDRWRPLLTPGDVMHRSSSSIGVWGEGFKISVFATGRKIDIMTNDRGRVNQIHIPVNFLEKDDWVIPVYKGIEKGISIEENQTILRMIGAAYNEIPYDTYPLMKFLGETFGTRIRMEEEEGYEIEITVNGNKVKPKTFGLPQDIIDKYTFPPGVEPSQHIFHENGLKIRMVIGLLHTMDSENYGVYMYGNGRLFASRLRNDIVGFGTRANSPIPADHPFATRLQIHVFFEGNPDKIPWQAPLKDSIVVQHPVVDKVADLIKKHAAPYADFMKAAKTPELVIFSQKWNDWDEEKRKKEIFTAVEKRDMDKDEIDEKWKTLPDEIKGAFEAPKRMDEWDHGVGGKGRKPTDAPKFDRMGSKKLAKMLKERDKGERTSIEIIASLVGYGEGLVDGFEGPLVPRPSGEEGDEPRLVFEPPDQSVTLSVRMTAQKANDLAMEVGEFRKSDLLNKIIDGYEIMQTLKEHPYFLNKKKVWKDSELIEEIRKILDNNLGAKKDE